VTLECPKGRTTQRSRTQRLETGKSGASPKERETQKEKEKEKEKRGQSHSGTHIPNEEASQAERSIRMNKKFLSDHAQS
jgi:hypothetical protein